MQHVSEEWSWYRRRILMIAWQPLVGRALLRG